MHNKHILKKFSVLPLISVFCGSFLLSACGDQVAAVLEGKEARAERYHEEGKAVGNACRHAGRAIEDCYTIYSWLPRAGIFEGWREMDKYMRKYSLDTVKPILPPPENPNAPKKEEPKKKKKKSKNKDENAENSENNTSTSTIEPAPLEEITNEPKKINDLNDLKNVIQGATADSKDSKNPKNSKDSKDSKDPKEKDPKENNNSNKIEVHTTPDGELVIR